MVFHYNLQKHKFRKKSRILKDKYLSFGINIHDPIKYLKYGKIHVREHKLFTIKNSNSRLFKGKDVNCLLYLKHMFLHYFHLSQYFTIFQSRRAIFNK